MALGLDGYDTDDVLKRHRVALAISIEDQQAEAISMVDERLTHTF